MDHSFCSCDLYYRPFIPASHRKHFDKLLGYDVSTDTASRAATSVRSSTYSRYNHSVVTEPSSFHSLPSTRHSHPSLLSRHRRDERSQTINLPVGDGLVR